MADDGLSFLLELDAKTHGLDGMLKMLEQTTEALRKTERAVPPVTDELSRLQSKLQGLERPARIEEIRNRIKELETPTVKAVDEMESLSKTIQALERPNKLEAMRKRIEDLRNPVKELKPPIETNISAFGRMTAAAGSFVAKVVTFELVRRAVSGTIDMFSALARKVLEVGSEMMHAAAKAERTQISFKLLMGNEGGQEMLDWIEDIAKHTEFTGDEIQGMVAGLAKAGFEGMALKRALAAAVDMAAFSGSSSEGAGAAVAALSMINLKGEANFRALKNFGIKEEDYMEALAERLGTTADKGYEDATGTIHQPFEALKQKITLGQVSTEDMLETLNSMIVKRTGQDLGGAGVLMSRTMEARIKKLKDLPSNFYQKLAGTSGFSKISNFMGDLLEAFDPEGPTGQRIQGALTRLVDTIGDALGGIDIEDLVTKLERGITAITENVGPAIVVFQQFWEILMKVGSALSDLIELAGKYTPLGFIADQIAGDAAEKAGLNDSVLGERMVGKNGAEMRAKIKASGGAIGAALPASALAGVNFGLPALRTAGPLMGAALSEPLRYELGLNSPSKVFMEMGMMTGLGFQQGVEKSMANADSAMQDAFGPTAPTGGVGGGSTSISLGGIHVTVAGGGNDAAQIASTVAAKIEEIAPGMLQSALERLAMQAGGA